MSGWLLQSKRTPNPNKGLRLHSSVLARMEPRMENRATCSVKSTRLPGFPVLITVHSRSWILAVLFHRNEPMAPTSETPAVSRIVFFGTQPVSERTFGALSAGTAVVLAGAVVAVEAVTDRNRVRSVGNAPKRNPRQCSAGAWPFGLGNYSARIDKTLCNHASPSTTLRGVIYSRRLPHRQE
jgi:hypothetical protein